jgi:hypothetical protein
MSTASLLRIEAVRSEAPGRSKAGVAELGQVTECVIVPE